MRKKAESTEKVTYEITPELHQRAIGLLVDILLRAAEEIGGAGSRGNARRIERGFKQPTSAAIVSELASQMAVRLARHLDDGELLAVPVSTGGTK